ncbi:MAG: alkaline phosphatase D family protein, partial [Sulfurihydrogenibium sp.]
MLTRREFIGYGVSTLFLLSLNEKLFASDTPDVFPLGIASGDPTQNSIVLWTKLNPDVIKKGAEKLNLHISNDPEFKKYQTIHIDLKRLNPKTSTLKITISDLKPGNQYYYRFEYRGISSLVGKFRTLPNGKVDNEKIVFVKCQNYAEGFYTAYKHIAQEEALMVVHLGHQIYEKRYGDPLVSGRDIQFPSGKDIANTLEDYIYLYNTYLSDKDYQLARATTPFVYIWDDHEYAHVYSFDYSKRLYALPTHPDWIKNNPKLVMELRKYAIYAWNAFTPADAKINFSDSNPLKWIKMYRDFKIGDIAHLICTDERSYREPQPCGIGCKKIFGNTGCEDQYKTSMLGKGQKEWFFEKLKEKGQRWKVWANAVQFVESKVNNLFVSLDAWSGYLGESKEIIDFLDKNKLYNTVILTGNRYATLIAEVRKDNKNSDSIVAVEYM